MADTKHSDLMNLPHEYKGAHGNGGSAPIGLPSHPQRLMVGSTASENVSPATAPEMFRWQRKVKAFDISNKDDIEAYEALFDNILSGPQMINGQAVHWILFKEETTSFNGKYTILVQWHMAYYDGTRSEAVPVSLPSRIETVDRSKRAAIRGGAGPTVITEGTPADYQKLASDMKVDLSKKDPTASVGSRPPIQGKSST